MYIVYPVNMEAEVMNKADLREADLGGRVRQAGGHEVAETILKQLGAVTLAMLGAHEFVAGPDSLQFAIKGSRRASKIRIVLDEDDTYNVEFWTGRGVDMHRFAKRSGVYVEQLHELIERETGLFTHYAQPVMQYSSQRRR